MSNEQQRTDYTPRDTYAKRASWGPNMKRPAGDRYFGQTEWIEITFNTDFDIFAANAAHALRHRLFYRTDGGKFARGLVRESGDLQRIHNFFLNESKMDNKEDVRLRAVIVRRKHPAAKEQWELTVRFAVPQETVDEDEGEVITSNPYNVADAEKKLTEKVIGAAIYVADEIKKKHRIRGERIVKIVSIANRFGYPGCMKLFHYNPELVRQYIDLNTSNARRQQMTVVTGGKFPFDGHGGSQSGPWRRYPFKEIVRQCAGKNASAYPAIIHNELLATDDRIFAIQEHVEEVENKGIFGGGSAWGPLADAFVRHLKKLQDSRDDFLSAYKQ